MKKDFCIKLLGALFLSAIIGCSATQQATLQSQPATFSDFLVKVQTLTVQDVQRALADVHAHGDVDLAALQCYPELMNFLNQQFGPISQPVVDGIISANQLKRDVIVGGTSITNGALGLAVRKLHVACSAYVNDEVRFAVEFAAMIGAASHGVPPITGLPTAIQGVIAP